MADSAVAPAVAIMTAWASTPSSTDFLNEVAWEYLHGDDADPQAAIRSLVVLNSILLVRLEKQSGVAPAATLQQIAEHYRNVP